MLVWSFKLESVVVQRNWKKVTVRLEPEKFKALDDAAHASCLPLAVFVRSLVLGVVPPPAPPAIADLDPQSAELLRCCHSMVSNGSQLSQAAMAIGEPYSRLAAPSGALTQIGAQARALGLLVKAGGISTTAAKQIMQGDIANAAGQLNDLAHQINLDAVVEPQVWQQVLVLARKTLSHAMGIAQAGEENGI